MLDEAKGLFTSCKERYGLSTSEITEKEFFNSLSKFIEAYRKTQNEVVERTNRRKRCGGTPRPVIISPPTHNDDKPKASQAPRRKSWHFSTKGFKQSEKEVSETGGGELGKSLFNMLLHRDKPKLHDRPKGRLNNSDKCKSAIDIINAKQVDT